MITTRRRRAFASTAGLAALAVTTALVVAPAEPATSAPSCASFTRKVFDSINPTTGAQHLTRGIDQTLGAYSGGWTTVRPYSMSAAQAPGTSLAGVHRLYRSTNHDYLYTLVTAEITAAKRGGYVDQGVVFYAATSASTCTLPVWRFTSGSGVHRYVTSASDRSSLRAAGWKDERVAFDLGKPSLVPVVSIAVIPDTQEEVYRSTDLRFGQRIKWLIANKDRLGIAYVTHTGDVVSWDTADHNQYVNARAALAPLAGRIPYSLSPGNHDTAAVGIGGSAADPPTTYLTVRDTRVFNAYLGAGLADMAGQYEYGKVDNQFNVFSAGGRQWLVLNLELWPRRAVVDWARSVVESHPHHNVVIVTHSYLTASGSIYNRVDYGATSPQYLYDNLVQRYPNIKIVVSGHTGTSASRVDTTPTGNVVNSFLLAMHDRVTNPVRIIEMNPVTNQVDSVVYAPWDRRTYPSYWIGPRPAAWVR